MSNLNASNMLHQLAGQLQFTVSSPWAVLLVQFSDQTGNWPPMNKYQDLFTSTGSGKQNMVDYFRDVSHNKIDISGSKVFGPYTLPAKRSDYDRWNGVDLNAWQPGKSKLGAWGIVHLAEQTATNAKANLKDFSGVCVSFLGQVDLYGFVGGMAAVCDTFSLQPSLLGQEMGHGYGLDHSRIFGSTADYQDPWDTMSTANAFEASNPEFDNVGPGLNASNMRGRGWLDESRVWTSPLTSFDTVIDLRPLHRTDLSGFLAAQVGSYLVEFRVPQRWDAAIPRACILVHSFSGNRSYLMRSYNGSRDIVEGDKFTVGDPNYPIFGYYAAEVRKIDVQNLTATIALHQRPAHPVSLPGGQGPIGLPMPGSDTIALGDKVIKVPANGPARDLIEQFARYLQIEISTNNAESALAAQRQTLEEVLPHLINLYQEAAPFSEQPPGYPGNPQGSQHAEPKHSGLNRGKVKRRVRPSAIALVPKKH